MSSRLLRDAARALICWLIAATGACAQQSSIEVRSPSAKLIETTPGRIITASVVVENRGGQGDEIVEKFTLPSGCQKVAPPDLPFRLEPGGQMVRVLAVLVPASMPAGRFGIRYTAQSRRDASSSGSIDLEVVVTSVENVELVVEPRPDVVLAGDVYPVKLHVTNHGNSRVAVQLTTRSNLNFPVEMSAPSFSLDAGATREIICQVKTDKAYPKRTHHAVTFDLTATSPSGKSVTASQASVADLIPQVSGSRDPFHYLPMQLRLMTLAELDHDPQLQAELSGAGSLDEAGKHKIDFVFRGPDVQDSSLFGERDEYGASYHGENWDVQLGDRVFELSPLTEKHSLGRGAGVTWHDEQSAAGVFYMQTRFRQQNTEEIGAFVRRDLTPVFSLQGNFLRKSGGDLLAGSSLPQSIVTLETHYRSGKLLDLRLEGGISLGDHGGSDFAYRAEARGQLPGKINYSVEHVHADPNFQGYYNDTDTTYVSVTKEFTPKFRAHVSMNRYAGNLALNDVRSSVVNREDSWNGGVDYTVSKQTTLSAEVQHVKRADILKPAAYDFTSDAVRVGVGHDFGKIRLQSFLEIGTLDNSITGESGPFQRYSATASWQASARQTYSVFASYGPSAFTGSTEKELSIGASAHWQVRDNLDANLSYAHNQFDSLTGHEQDQFLGSVRYQFQNKSALSVIGRWSRAASKSVDATATNEAAVLVTYSIPLSMPVSRKRSIGALQGRLCDSSKGIEGKGLPRVVLQIGEQFAVTDSAGNFEFPALKPGACELTVVPDSLGPNYAMATPLPMKVRIRSAETTHVDLKATPACTLTVRVARYDFANGNSFNANAELRETGGQEGLAVELSNGRDTWRAQTDRTGAATFDHLPDGRWTLRVAGRDLPEFHTLETPEQAVTLKSGESRQLALRLLPQRRTLRLLDHGTIR